MKVTPNLLGEWEISCFFAGTIIFCNFRQLSFHLTIRYTVIGAIKGKSKINTSNWCLLVNMVSSHLSECDGEMDFVKVAR